MSLRNFKVIFYDQIVIIILALQMTSQISEFLRKLMLQKYKDKFVGGPLFVGSVGEFSGFLSDPNKLKEVGMTVFEINRFKRLCRETIEVNN